MRAYSTDFRLGMVRAYESREVMSKGGCVTRGRTNRMMQQKGRIQACVQSLFPGSPGAFSNGSI